MKHTPEQLDALRRRLNDGGCPVLSDDGYKISPIGLVIETIPGMNFSRILSLKNGGTGYAIELAIRNEANGVIDVRDFQIKTPWGVPRVSLLPAERKPSKKYGNYCFPEPGPYYDAEWVLNHIFAGRRSRLKPGEELEGVVVAWSKESIPADFKHLGGVIATFTIFDSHRNAFSTRFGAPVVRWETMARDDAKLRGRTKAMGASRRSNLPANSLIAPPAPKGMSDKERVKIARDFDREMSRIHKHAKAPHNNRSSHVLKH